MQSARATTLRAIVMVLTIVGPAGVELQSSHVEGIPMRMRASVPVADDAPLAAGVVAGAIDLLVVDELVAGDAAFRVGFVVVKKANCWPPGRRKYFGTYVCGCGFVSGISVLMMAHSCGIGVVHAHSKPRMLSCRPWPPQRLQGWRRPG
jgi:hypothetical protein